MFRRVLAATIVAAPALAMAAPAEPLSVEWNAHDGCPDLNDFWRAVVTRSSRIRRASTGESAPRAKIVIRRSGDRSVATFTLGGAPREVAAATCGEVVDAVALMTVLALDPDALVAPEPVAPPAPIVAPEPPPPPAPKVEPVASVVASPVVDTPSAAPPPGPTSITLSAGGQLLAVGAGAAHGVVVALEFDRGSTAIRLSAGRAESDLVRNEFGPMARFTFETLRLDGCPWSWGETLRIAPCFGVSGGALTGTRENVSHPRPTRRPWFALHALGRGDLRFSRYFGLEFELGLSVPLLRDEFAVEPDYFLYRPPVVMLSSQLSLAVHFP